ncbi:unnamed protein product [Psylliodes chrysocephalus]|uniref:Phorbol-ester/DAG-type domain-containing protein n=1 Tax=Psylliodes chrysocephalus TaxID=3402493 RepID=A0A9P0D090_9CUCU|nr:unnamed protein product [Psylliodes chrysocephala]
MSESNKCDLPCLRCKNAVTTGIRCIQCGRLSHKSCLEILKITLLSKETVNCCNQSATSKNNNIKKTEIPTSFQQIDSNESMKVSYLERIIRDKESIIENLHITIEALKEQLDLMKALKSSTESIQSQIQNERSKPSSIPCLSEPQQSSLKRTHNLTEQNFILQKADAIEVKSSNPITKAALATALYNEESRNTLTSVINLEKDVRPKALLVGSLENTSDGTLRASEFVKTSEFHYHATNFAPDVSSENLQKHLQKFAPNVKVQKLNSRNPDQYSSFKISLPPLESGDIMDSKIWPYKVFLNRFFPSRKLKPQTD